ncbi:winged helix-turn-helix transcriptional regulator [Streptacidiphilus jiangxiensis]|uniref:HxlR-like helix-turn-helix n=1 Tax=Streptacidiphilus jiangxiensis TaxID=235985 RepID=A0A1H7T200_STRJI|nr:hypothetical protein [Streptacidiphilus jiangxiensis]SEL78519.1 hypothetical protein SAMN05414137_11316 [Streptacidiphilus jiangxiensis]
MTPTSPDSKAGAAPLPGRPCSVAEALHIVGEKWALLAVRELLYRNHRFDTASGPRATSTT